jgi:Periplasmic copper-binding protein (NosD)
LKDLPGQLYCVPLRSEGVVLRAVGDSVVVANNFISDVQAGVFVNGATGPQVVGNTVSSVDALDGIHILGSISGTYTANRIFHVGPFTTDTSNDKAGCGVNVVSGTGSSGNYIAFNSINDAFCGVGYVSTDSVGANVFFNVLYLTLNGDNYPTAFPPPTEPGQ